MASKKDRLAQALGSADDIDLILGQGRPKAEPKKETPKAEADSRKPVKKKANYKGRVREVRSKRLNVVITPSLYEKLEREAERLRPEGRKQGMVNELINIILEDYLGD